jgi:UrcA family protein
MKTPVILLASALAFTAVPAFASDVEFAYSARELSSTAAVAGLYDRLADEADAACDLYENSGLLAVKYRKACADALADEIVGKIDSNALTALHEERHSQRFAERH